MRKTRRRASPAENSSRAASRSRSACACGSSERMSVSSRGLRQHAQAEDREQDQHQGAPGDEAQPQRCGQCGAIAARTGRAARRGRAGILNTAELDHRAIALRVAQHHMFDVVAPSGRLPSQWPARAHRGTPRRVASARWSSARPRSRHTAQKLFSGVLRRSSVKKQGRRRRRSAARRAVLWRTRRPGAPSSTLHHALIGEHHHRHERLARPGQ